MKVVISPHLDDRTTTGADSVPGDGSESRRQPRSGFVAALLREPRIAADVGDEERTDLGLPAEGLVALETASVLWFTKRTVDGQVYRRQIVDSTGGVAIAMPYCAL